MMPRPVLASLVVACTFLIAQPTRADIDCAQCRAVCRSPSSYPGDLRPDQPTSQGVAHHSAEAQAAFEAARGLDPGFGGHDVAGAIDGYKRAVVLDANNAQYRNYLAAALLAAVRIDEAIYNLEKAMQLVPTESKYLVNLGYAWHRRGDEQRALVWYLRALILDPRDARARLFSGYALEKLGMAHEATMEFRRVLNQEPGNAGARAGLERLHADVDLIDPAGAAP